MGLTMLTKAQTRNTESLLKITNDVEEEDTPPDDDDEQPPQEQPNVKWVKQKKVHNHVHHHSCAPTFCHFLFLDYGTARMHNNNLGVSGYANGSSWALGGQVGYHFRSYNDNNQFLITTGLEVRNYNGTVSNADQAGLYNDYNHYWYLGVPIMFQVVGTKNYDDFCPNDVNFYLQAGLTPSLKLYMGQSSDRTAGGMQNIGSGYGSIMLQPFMSVGVSYTTRHGIWLLGPYAEYSANNISNQSGVTERVTGYGIRLSKLPFR